MTNDKLHERLAKLKAHAESAAKIGSEAEAQAFATKLNQMLLEHGMEISDIEWESEVKEKAVHLDFFASRCTEIPKWARKDVFATWACELALMVAEFSGCRVLVLGNTASKIRGVVFIGLKLNAETALETMKYLYPAAVMIAQRAYDKEYNKLYLAKLNTDPVKGYRTSFLIGFVQRLRQRFKAHREEMRSQFTGTALVRISDALTVASAEVAKISDIKEVKLREDRVTNADGYRDGQKRANDMNIGGKQLA